MKRCCARGMIFLLTPMGSGIAPTGMGLSNEYGIHKKVGIHKERALTKKVAKTNLCRISAKKSTCCERSS